ncbi:MAG: GNAT family N-acetyltransferase [Candidatus Lokiarchaeota archaeon]|nr:GNAT family N-acetyltransferase [Candidatus Lokiarchaeota archaeon]
MKILPVENKDLLDLADIEKELFKEDAFGVFLLFHYLENNIIFSKILNEEEVLIGFGIVAELNQTILNPHELKFIKKIENRKGSIAHLVDFAIRTEFWHKGYGTRLLNHLSNILREIHYDWFYLEVNTSNRRAIEFYKHNRFREIGTISAYYSTGQDAILMLKHLNQSE